MLEPSLLPLPLEVWLLIWAPLSIPRTQPRFQPITPEAWGKSQGFQGMDSISYYRKEPMTGFGWTGLGHPFKTSKSLHCLQVPSLWSQLLSALICAIKWKTLCWLPLMIWSWPGFMKEVLWGSSVILVLFSSRTLQR